jgi:hypothetical protein
MILNGPTYLRANFPLTLNLRVPLIGETLRYMKSPISNDRSLLLYPHNFSVKIEQSLDFPESSEPSSRHPLILLDEISDFLQSDSRTTEFYTVIHIVP